MTIYRHRVTGPGSAGDMWTTTMHSQGAAALATVHAAWGSLVAGFIGSILGPMWPNEVSATSITTDQLDANGIHNVGQATSAVSHIGSGAGATLSPRTCVVLGLRTALPTRSGRGRMYWPAPDASHLTASGNLVSADASAIAAGFATRLTTFKTTSAPIILHRGHDKDANGNPITPVPSTFDPVTNTSVGVILGTQRRRTNRVLNAYSANPI
jgi:hypothetical protein